MKTLVKVGVTALLILGSAVCRGNIDIIPRPQEIESGSGSYEITASTELVYSKGAQATADYLAEVLAPAMGFELRVKRGRKSTGGIFLGLDEATADSMGPEGYTLKVGSDGIEITAATESGLFYGVQSLRQLLPVSVFATGVIDEVWDAPFVTIEDQPRFGWRGMHLDVGRHFMPKESVLKFIDLMAIHKFNTFHWHLTEDQGWRIEIKKYPKLTEFGAWRDETVVGHARHYIQKKLPFVYNGLPHGGYYTQDEVREVVAYASARHITVVPEIELPGHAQAAVFAYPEFASSAEKIGVKKEWGVSHHIYSPEDKTIAFLKDVMDEVLELFPSEFIHIGGDEATKTLWEKSPRIQELLKERGLKDMHEMQSWFVGQFDEYLTAKGRRLIGWDEILEGGLAEGATVMSWRGAKGGIAAASAGHDVVMAHNGYLYFDHYQSKDEREPLAIGGFNTLDKVYSYEPVPEELDPSDAKRILGAQGQLWTEYMPNMTHVEYMAFPRACALAELLWLPKEDKDYERFSRSLEVHLKRLSLQQVNFRPLHLDTAEETNRYQ